jgi:hypothetical protein
MRKIVSLALISFIELDIGEKRGTFVDKRRGKY